MWFLDLWGILIIFPLYLFHVLFFLWIAIEYKKTNIHQLYLFGIIFALYEAWVTKVLWAGYMDSAGPGLGTIFGVGLAEFSVLSLLWHPIMSFIVPILVFQVLTGKIFTGHADYLRKTRKSSSILFVCILLFSTFIANGNSFNFISANISVLGTLLLVFLVYRVSKDRDIMSLHFKKVYLRLIVIYLIVLYIVTFVLFLPERIPVTLTPYISVLLFYAIPLIVISKSEISDICLVELPDNSYSVKDLARYSLLLVLAVNFACLVPSVSTTVLGMTYFSMVFAGIVLFLAVFLKGIKNIRALKSIEKH
jgi:hypothetical protein